MTRNKKRGFEPIMNKQKEISLYVHIPFCVRKCNYCDFLSAPADEQTMERYVQALLLEIQAYQNTELVNRNVKSIYIGGGTPSILQPSLIKQILEQIKATFNMSEEALKQAEISMEMNPGTVDYEKCKAYYEMGINRISIGLQSTSDMELQMLGRIHSYDDFMSTYKMLRQVGFQNINVDLMSALPGQTLESYTSGLEKVLALKPEHISAYSLIIEEGTLFYDWYEGNASESGGEVTQKTGNNMTRMPLPDEDVERKMYEITGDILSTYGYQRYEISNYAKEGHACQHNIVYWQRGDYLGFGIGAASLINDIRFSNIDCLDEYIKYQMQSKEQKKQAKGQTNVACEQIEQTLQVETPYFIQCARKELCKLDMEDQMEEYMFWECV